MTQHAFTAIQTPGEMMIEACGFGKMVIGGHQYDSDLWIYPDRRVRDAWWRSQGHRMSMTDIEDLVATQPDILVVGTGIYGRMRLDAAVASDLQSRDIELKAQRTKTAAESFNRLLGSDRRVAACFHLTC